MRYKPKTALQCNFLERAPVRAGSHECEATIMASYNYIFYRNQT